MYYFDGEYQDAAEMYSKALELNDSDYQVWSFLGSAYKYSDPPQPDKSNDAMIKAMELAEERLEVNPRDAGLLIDLASFQAETGNEQRAEEMLSRAINLRPGDVMTQSKIGGVLVHLGDREGALEWFGRAIENGYPVEEIYRSPDPDILALTEDPDFQAMVEKLQSQQ
jgi:tetratricopeptide (TPR) repeat protein